MKGRDKEGKDGEGGEVREAVVIASDCHANPSHNADQSVRS